MDFHVLVFISLFKFNISAEPLGVYEKLDRCFEEREKVVESIGRPIVNYQALCIRWREDLISI